MPVCTERPKEAFVRREPRRVRQTLEGDAYAVFINGSATAATTFTTDRFSSGGLGLYDYNSQSFSNFSVSSVPVPGALLLFAPGIAGILAVRRRFAG